MLKFKISLLFIGIFSLLNAQEYRDIEIHEPFELSSLSALDSTLPDKKYFFVGENHIYQKSNYLIQSKLVKYLHQKAGLNKIILEFGPGTGWLINKFITTGDTTTFNELKKYFSTENLSLYVDLYQYNKENPSSKLTCHGIDLERFPRISIAALYHLIPKKQVIENDSISISIESLKAIYSISEEYTSTDYYINSNFSLSEIGIYNTFKIWLENYESLKVEYQKYLGENYEVFNTIVQGLISGKNWFQLKDQKALQETVFREQFMYNSFKQLEKEYPQGKFYGQFGRCHIRTENSKAHCYSYAMKSLVYRIKEQSRAQNIMVIPIFYVRNVFLKEKKYIENSITNFWGLKEAVFLVKVPPQTNLSEEFISEIEFAFINNLKLSKDQLPADPYRKEREKKKIPSLRFSAEVDMGISHYNFGDLNSYLAQRNIAGFKNHVISVGGIASVYSPYGFYYGLQFQIGLTQRTNTDSVSLKLNSYNILVNIGTSLLNTKWFSFNPSIGIGGGNFKLSETRIIPDQNSMNLLSENNQNYTVYKNPSFLIDIKGEIKFNIKMFSISFRGGYLFDVTNKHWKNPNILPNSPNTAMMGWHIKGGLGINLKVY